MRLFRAVLALLSLAAPLHAQNPNPAQPVVRVWEAAAMLGFTGGAMAIDQRVRHLLRRHDKTVPSVLVRAGDALGNVRFVLPALVGGTLVGGTLDANGGEGIGLRALESTGVSAAVALALKSAIGRRRPDSKPNTPFAFRPFAFTGNSFPSGHTAIAFALATSLASETKDRWSDALFYAGGTLTAFARINDDKHWFSDTVFGAAIGIMSARLVQRWHRKSQTGTALISVRFSF
jgi:membrane-associated phospholipid phosphatase